MTNTQTPITDNCSEQPKSLHRYLSDKKYQQYLKPLSFLAKKVRDSKGELDLQLRNDYLNIYYKGNSLALIELMSNQLKVSTNSKFKLADAISKDSRLTKLEVKFKSKKEDYEYIVIDDFSLFNLVFQDKIINALSSKIKEANYKEEITFEQSIITDNLDNKGKLIFIDRQVAGGGIPGTLDLLGVIRMESGNYKFVVLEVKLGNNTELRHKVADQLLGYVNAIEANFDEFKKSYEKNYMQKYSLGLFAEDYPSSIEIEEGVLGKILVGSYRGIAKNQIKQLNAAFPVLKNDVIELYHDLSSLIRM